MLTRVLLTVGTLVFAAACYALMLKGWRSRQRRQGDLPPPRSTSDGPGRVIVPAVPGLFVGTTSAEDWLDRIAVHHLSDRATAELAVATDGVRLLREGLPELWLPLDDLLGATVEQALAGKVVSGGMLVLTWRLGPRTLASAFRATDRRQHARLRDAITSLLPVEAA